MQTSTVKLPVFILKFKKRARELRVKIVMLINLLCLIVEGWMGGGGSNKMHQGGNY